MNFRLTTLQQEMLRVWIASEDVKVAVKQGREEPNYGANGGAYTYMFTPTSLGTIVRVVNEYTHQSIDLTDYNSW